MKTKKRTTDKSLRVLTSNMSSSSFKKGEMIEFFDDSPSPMGRVPKTLTIGTQYEVLGVEKCVVCVQNDRRAFQSYYSSRFKRVAKTKSRRRRR